MRKLCTFLLLSLFALTSFAKSNTDSADSDVKKSINKVIKAINKKQYCDIQDLFTEEGYDMYLSLIAYGSAEVSGNPIYSIYNHGDKKVVRSIPMSFSYKNCPRNTFVENIVFTLNSDNLIESVSYALDDQVLKAVMEKTMWSDESKSAIIGFLEEYRTAYPLKRYDFIANVFDQGYIAVPPECRLHKLEYLTDFNDCCIRNEFINVSVTDINVLKNAHGGEVYGIQLKPEFYTSEISNTGYQFLLVDFNDPDSIKILVSAWQSEPDPDFGLYDISSF